MCACFNLRKASRAVTHSYDSVLRASGLRATQFSVLVGVSLRGEAPVGELADMLGLNRTTLTRNLGVLESNGLVAVSPGRDRRARHVSLTEAGERALREALPLWRKAQSKTVESLGPERWDGLLENLSRLSGGRGSSRSRSLRS